MFDVLVGHFGAQADTFGAHKRGQQVQAGLTHTTQWLRAYVECSHSQHLLLTHSLAHSPTASQRLLTQHTHPHLSQSC